MEVKIVGRKAYIVEITSSERAYLVNKLTYEISDQVYKTLIYKDNYGPYKDKEYILYGHLKYIRSNGKIEISNFEKETIKVENQTLPAADIVSEAGINLYPEQLQAVKKALLLREGGLEIATGGGKSFILVATLKHLIKTGEVPYGVVIVPSIFLAKQLKESFMSAGFDKDQVNSYHTGKKDTTKASVHIFVVNTLQIACNSVLNEENADDIKIHYFKLLRNSKFVAFDEAHTTKSPTAMEVGLLADSADYFLGFSGSFFLDKEDVLKNVEDSILAGLFDKTICDISGKYLRKKGRLSNPLVLKERLFQKTNYKKMRPNKVVDTYILNNDKRNELIIDHATRLSGAGYTVLILVSRKEHGLKLLRMLSGKLNALAIFGAGKTFVLENGEVVQKKIDFNCFKKEFKEGKYNVVLGSSVLDMGVDLPSLGSLILAGAGKSKRNLLQRIGRVSRKKKGTDWTFIIDFDDTSHVFLKRQFLDRFGVYTSEDIKVTESFKEFYSKVRTESIRKRRYAEDRGSE